MADVNKRFERNVSTKSDKNLPSFCQKFQRVIYLENSLTPQVRLEFVADQTWLGVHAETTAAVHPSCEGKSVPQCRTNLQLQPDYA